MTHGGKDKDRRQRDAGVPDDRRQGDRREAERVPLEIWVEEVHGAETLYRQTGNLSLGGVQLERGLPKPVGTRVRLRFGLPGSEQAIEIDGEVVSATVAELTTRIKFVELDEPVRARIEDFLARARRR